MKSQKLKSQLSPTGSGLSFLEAIAQAYTQTFPEISDFCFVFPNKRAGAFFLRALGRCIGTRTIIAPEILTISDFMTKVSRRDVDSRIDLLFRLYNIYCRVRKKDVATSNDAGLLDFDSFRSWGETLLSDFSEIDNYYVDKDALFSNISDFRQISSNFLNDEQLDILERYFGYRPSLEEIKGFWKHFSTPDNLSDLKSHFLYMWQMMLPLYDELNNELEAEGLATSGGAARAALEAIMEYGIDILPWKKVVFVGFNALSTCESLIFENLKKLGGFPEREEDAYADFFWDGTGPVLDANDDASYFLQLNRRNFPSPKWAEPFIAASDVKEMPPSIRVVGSPSNSIQAKIAGMKVDEFLNDEKEKINDARVAVVLPDENLLLPLLYSLPDGIGKVNLTMGYSLRLTAVASFLYHLRKLQTRARLVDGAPAFYYNDLKVFLSHPFVHATLGSNVVKKINTYVSEKHLFNVKLSEIAAISGEAAILLDTTPYGRSTSGVIRYVDDVLMKVDTSIAESEGGILKSKIDRSHIALYRDAIRRLEQSASRHGIDMSFNGVFYMIDKLLAGERVMFEGKPLEGLQVMGLLETRTLDFDRLIILSLNDSIMPRKARSRTFIPDALRSGYGMPYANYKENLFAYYFYRMISRARDVTLIYDARAGEGMRSGGESRYLLQLKYLYGGDNIKYETCRFLLSDSEDLPRPVEKTEMVMGKLNEFTVGGGSRNLSASALRKYCECPVKFYYEVVAQIKTDPEPGEYIDALMQGNIVHEVMLNLYFPKHLHNKYLKDTLIIGEEQIQKLINDEKRLEQEVVRAINRLHFMKYDDLDAPLEGAAFMVGNHLVGQIKDILEYDLGKVPFELAGGEVGGIQHWEFAPGRKVNMNYAIDRLDIQDPDGERRWRIVDYKTGGNDVEAREFDDIFNGYYKAKNIFQLMLYANLLNMEQKMDEDVAMSIYEVDSISKKGERVPKINGEKIEGHKSINESFTERLNGILQEIFNPLVPFLPTEDNSHCRFCPVKDLCHGR